MKIGYISHEFPAHHANGGIGTYVKQMATGMATNEFEVHVFAGSLNKMNSEYIDGYTIHYIKCISPEDFREKVLHVFMEQQAKGAFNLIESAEINANAWDIKKKYPLLPLVVRLHAPNYLVEKLKKEYIPFFDKMRFVLGALRRFKFDLGYWRIYNKNLDEDYQFIQLADYITAPSEAMKKWVLKNWEISPDKITVIPNLFLPSTALLSIPIEEESKYRQVIFFGRLNALKGLVNATWAMKTILKLYPDWKFRIIGDDGPGPTNALCMRTWMRKELKDVIDRVEFIDGVLYEKLPDLIIPSEIVLLPSLFESFSYTCAEAMAAGKAIIGSSNGGMADLLEQDKSGLLVNPYDLKAIIAALKKIINDNSFRIQLSTEARKRIVHVFHPQKTLMQFADFYKKVIVE